MPLSKSQMRDFGALLQASFGDENLAITSGAGQDGVENNGNYVAIPDGAGVKRPESATPVLLFTTTLDADETLILNAMNGQDADDAAGTGVADFDTENSVTVAQTLATGGGGGTTATGAFVGPTLNLVGASTHIRFQYTVTLSRGATDTCGVHLAIIWGGYGKEPTDALIEDSNA